MNPFTVGNVESVVSALLLVVSFTLFVISLFSLAKRRTQSLAFLSVAFLLFFLESMLYTIHIFLFYFSNLYFTTLSELLILFILLLIFVATYRQ
jgi:NADH:ubiquinone oxidoreductase subunit K